MKQLIGLSLLMVAFCLPTGFRSRSSCPAAAAAATLTSAMTPQPIAESVWIYNSDGDPEEVTTDSYVAGHIYDDDLNLVGTVPNPVTDGSIFDVNNNNIGFIDPSPTATEELGG